MTNTTKSRVRRLRIKAGGPRHTETAFRLVCARQSNRCYYCNRVSRQLTRDHRVPLSKGGTDSIANIVAACRPCNSRKGTKVP